MTASLQTGSSADPRSSDAIAASGALPLPVPLSSHSRFVQRLRRRYAGELALLPPGAPVRPHMITAFEALRTRGDTVGDALRIVRQLVMERLAVIDCDAQAPLEQITTAVTQLAEFALDTACCEACRELEGVHGAPRGPEGQPARIWVVGMGKLGARELNVSSDIDLIYLYDLDGETDGNATGSNRIANQDFFARVVKRIYALVGDITEHGFVFRVDLALRPNGNSGPSAVSLDALEEYFQVQGREWERFAWLKSRVVAPLDCIADTSAQALRTVVLPFVFRRYLDYSVFDALRVLHQQIRDQAARRSAGRPARANDVKLSRGGIREIEFTVQLLQVVRGGQYPELRTRPTLDALQRLARAGLMPQETADALAEAYVFLRRVEHRIQYLDDQQTHVLPVSDEDLRWIALTLGSPDCCAFLSQLDAHRELVAQEFDKLLGGEPKPCNGKCNGGKNGKAAAATPADLTDLLDELPPAFADRIRHWVDHPRVQALREETQARLRQLVQRTGRWLREEPDGDAAGQTTNHVQAALRWADWIEPLLRRESYLALLVERPAVQQRLLRLLGAAKWPARYLLQHPGVIDELASDEMLTSRFQAEEFERELEARHDAMRSTGEADEEAMLNMLRRAHHAEVFRTLARDVEGRISVEQVADDLSALADAVLRVTARWCWPLLRNRHRAQPQFAIVGYGKLGGKELGYGSDLDIVFVYEDDDERASEIYAGYVRKLINWMTVKTAEGDLFEIDTALRPNGNSGLLTISFAAYEKYQLGRGSNTAWTWEHQAMTRARFVLGDAGLGARFDAIREAVITSQRDVAALRTQIVAMREKVRAAHPVKPDRFDVKHSPGGMVDAEFAVQFLVLSEGASHPSLLPNVGNIALLLRAEEAGLLPAGVGRAASEAYRELRRVQHRARLNEEPTQVPMSALASERSAMLVLWKAVFG
ncbi:bifunctional [glutamate--ammonia ligase]-adenylyl-L-tyrosine phosphorylase/[glutamate--ammonia-ligase] adenylyltransferase [Variovorax sp. J22G21]|uniref:bifunctional [glutamate--ammonia ligase]-adenylyl-L-tyrosine phosphorylase/[glutamate--ammonia-ligase] adenylyltransferase n=1 Tax=Variovorax fucosicus TaxID=3053517 RepID=UPI00257629B0|nr:MULTISPECIES: bifunctional [glutamate--ammonia ligase]-adenylyl-L-tyrosine phosphorylase/[glutamate--ammonia-ligase] adenylyltransferase [unclassified Variovorax]MDM0039498.1 bifunctional [glutamate--ammonia ligase]-adenylyl-L-tyrosine phosphorylase/[glutamate--ammonia-ligase] adenylyltransferase [Variovorax sp. J22R193]MDM0064273.1 bifunctional [glutamate--ammonia ligase]-adenylyl-L-tyrosine phosphorylase/[glutamate--ammonia-ligase] adenylyltransferase [Variovorax sp. J22G21]